MTQSARRSFVVFAFVLLFAPLLVSVRTGPVAAAPTKRLVLTVAAPAGPLALGDEAALTLVVTNPGAEAVENVWLYLPLEHGVEWLEPAGGPWVALGTLAGGESRTVTARLRVATIPRAGVLRFFVGATGDDAKPGRERVELLVPRALPETTTVPAAGDEVTFAGGRVRLVFPPGWKAQDGQVTFQLEELTRQQHRQRGRLLLFTLTATAGGAPVASFDAPVAVTLAVGDLAAGDTGAPAPAVSTAPTADEVWTAVEADFDPAAGTLAFTTTEPAAVQATTDPELWRLTYNPPGASAYSGAATTSYPIELPPGIGGLTPDLSLSYSSRAAEGLSYPAMGQGFGAGWALPQAQINNGNSGLMYGEKNGQCDSFSEYRFTLVLNGATYYLKPLSVDNSDHHYGQYQAIGSPELLIEFVRDDESKPENDTANVSGEFWRVRTADGTTYSFGRTTDAEQVVWPVSTTQGCNYYQPRNPAFSPHNWKLDRITDVHGNQITYSYKTACGHKDASPYADRGENANGGFQCSEVDVSVETVGYNFSGSAAQTTATFTYAQVNEGVRRKAQSMTAGVLRPATLDIRQNGARVSSYDFTYESSAHRFDPWSASTEFWWLTGVTRHGTGSAVLPPQTFSYVENTGQGCRDGVCVKLLATVDNGYGAVTRISYGVVPETIWRYAATVDTWDGVAYRYSAGDRPQTRLKVVPSVNRVGGKVQWCYDKPFDTNNNPCHSLMGYDQPSEALIGFNTTTIETQAPNGASNWTTLNKTTLTFYNDNFWLLGKTDLTEQFAASGDKLSQADYNWVQPDSTKPYVFLEWEAQATFQPGDVATYVGNTITYTYYAVDPDSGQFGGLKWKLEKDEAGRAYRCTEYAYVHKTDTTWLINKPARETVKSGDCAGTRRAETLYRYAPSSFPGDTSLDARGLLTYILRWSPRGTADYYATEKIAYNAQGLPTVVTTYSDLSSASTYIGSGSVRNTTTTSYTPLGLPQTITTSATDIFDQTQTIGYDTTLPWLVSSVTDANNVVTGYGYDAFGRLSKIAAPGDTLNAPTMTHAYSDGPAPWRIQTTYKNTVRNAERQYYDGLGRLVQSQTDNAEVDGLGDRDIVVSYAYDARGLEVCRSVSYAVAASSNSFQTAACASVAATTTAYDALGRVTSVTTPNGVAETTYNISQNITVGGGGGQYGPARSTLMLTSYFDAADHRVNQYHDVFGRLVLVREFTGSAAPYTPYADTRYTYDERDNLTRVGTGPHNNSQPGSFERETTISYDELGRKTGMTDPDMGTWEYGYDAAGNLIRQTASDNKVICFCYDNLDRLLRRAANGTSTSCPAYSASPASGVNHLASYRYGGYVPSFNNGRLIEVSWGSNPTDNKDTFTYDNQGRLKKQTRVINAQTFGYEVLVYDALDRPQEVKYPDGKVLITTYDQEGVDALRYDNTAVIDHLTYTALGRPAKVDRAGGLADTTYDYHLGDENFRLKSIVHGTGTTFPGFTYSGYDNAGNLTNQTIWGKAYTYSYDEMNRLMSVRGNLSQNYTYDRLGNFETATKWGTTWDYVYQTDTTLAHKPLRLTSVSGLNFSAALSSGYDARGNLIQYTQENVTSTLAYDVEGRLTKVTTQQSGQPAKITEFFYDADGNRVRTRYPNPNGATIYTPYPDYEEEVPPTGATTRRVTLSANGQTVALWRQSDGAAEVFSLHTDHLGSVVAVGNAGGGLETGSYALYEPFGAFLVPPTATNPSVTDRGFTGHKHNNLSPGWLGLVYMNARYYHPQLGRFVSPDTIVPEPGNPQSYNRYAYALNDPLKYTDPTGHRVISGCDQRDCTLGGQINPDVAYESADGNHSVVDPYLSAKYPSAMVQAASEDAYGLGVTANVSLDTPIAGIELMGGREVVHVRQSGETTQFIIIGGAIRVGPSTSFLGSLRNLAKGGSRANVSISPYGSIIRNVNNAVEDYSGLFAYKSTTVAYEAGVSMSEAYVPGDEGRIRANSVGVGPAFGVALTQSTGLSYAIPVVSHYSGRVLPVFHNPLPYLADLVSNRQIK